MLLDAFLGSTSMEQDEGLHFVGKTAREVDGNDAPGAAADDDGGTGAQCRKEGGGVVNMVD